MQGYSYSVFSLVAIAVHLIINFNMLASRGIVTDRGARYRGFLFGVLAYYIADAAWGVLAGLGWTRLLYVDTILYFLSLAVFALLLGRFVIAYIGLGKWTAGLITWASYVFLAINVILLVANFFNGCFFYFDGNGKYLCGSMRDPVFDLLIALNLLISAVVFAKAISGGDRKSVV